MDTLYLCAALSEYSAAAEAAGLQLPPYLQTLPTELLLLQAQPDQAAQAVYLVAPDATAVQCGVVTGSGVTEVQSQAVGKGIPGVATAAAAAKAVAWMTGTAVMLEQHPLSRGAATAAAAGDLHARAASTAAMPAAASDTAAASSSPATGTAADATAEQYVRGLLLKGRVLQAARAAQELGVVSLKGLPGSTGSTCSGVNPKEFLVAACLTGDLRVFAAVYRVFRDTLQRTFPKLDVAKQRMGFRAKGVTTEVA